MQLSILILTISLLIIDAYLAILVWCKFTNRKYKWLVNTIGTVIATAIVLAICYGIYWVIIGLLYVIKHIYLPNSVLSGFQQYGVLGVIILISFLGLCLLLTTIAHTNEIKKYLFLKHKWEAQVNNTK